MTQQPGEFEQKLTRLEAIVKTLENENVSLDDAVKLFQEGKQLSAECEKLLKTAQAQMDAGSNEAPQK